MANPNSPEERSCLRCCRSSCSLCKFCWIFGMSITFTGFLVSFSGGIYFMLQERGEYYYCLIAAVICLAVFGYLITTDFPSVNPRRRQPAMPLQVATAEDFRTLLRSQSEGVAINIPGRARSTISLPAYLVIPTEQREPEEASSASTESTLSAESGPDKLDEESGGAVSLPISVEQPVAPGSKLEKSELKRAAKVISQIVNETLGTKTSTKPSTKTSTVVTAEISSESSESSAAAESSTKGVRQRKPSPMEPQKYVLLPEGEKTA